MEDQGLKEIMMTMAAEAVVLVVAVKVVMLITQTAGQLEQPEHFQQVLEVQMVAVRAFLDRREAMEIHQVLEVQEEKLSPLWEPTI